MYLVRRQDKIIKLQSGIIDDLFELVCKKYDTLDGLDPLIMSIKDAADATKAMRGD